jgi:hypothetical protein
VNDIAIHYILKQNVIDLLRLTDKEYADNLVVLVSSVFDKNLTHEEIGLLNSHIESETVQEAILDLIPSNETAKKKMLMNISKYYIKIMMIYSAIVSTLDPQYMYEDETGEKQVFYLKDVQKLKKIPKGVSPVLQQLTNPMNLCKRRVNILKNKLDDTEDDVYIDRTLLELLEEVLAQAIESQEVSILTTIYQVTEVDDLLDVLLF